MTKLSLIPLLGATTLAIALPALAQNQLPNGNGKQVVEVACTMCHQANLILNAGHTRDEWDMIVHNMIAMGAMVKPEQV